jgi:hypothetical protein
MGVANSAEGVAPPNLHFAPLGGGSTSPPFVIKALPYTFKARYGEGCLAELPCDGPKAITSSATLYRGFKGRDKEPSRPMIVACKDRRLQVIL